MTMYDMYMYDMYMYMYDYSILILESMNSIS